MQVGLTQRGGSGSYLHAAINMPLPYTSISVVIIWSFQKENSADFRES